VWLLTSITGYVAIVGFDSVCLGAPATSTVTRLDQVATSNPHKLVPFTTKAAVDLVPKIERECPPAACPKDMHCPHQGGHCCGNGKSCCPAGFLCLNTFPGRCVPDLAGSSNRCTLARCKVAHRCPHPGVTACCLGGMTCCPTGFSCTDSTPSRCRRTPSHNELLVREQKDDLTIEVLFLSC